MNSLERFCVANGLDLQDSLKKSTNEIERFIHSLLASITSDNIITKKEQETIDSVCRFLKPSQEIIDEIRYRISRIKNIEKIRSGDIKQIEDNSIVTKQGEIIWHKTNEATLIKQEKKDITGYNGFIIITSERIVFYSQIKPVEIPLKNIISFDGEDDFLLIASKTQKSTCQFEVKDCEIITAYIDQAVNKYYRKLNLKQTASKTRSISQAVKNAVWERDGGQCVQCQSNSYLEYDHIIPFSKGGSNSEKNIQILCRGCNSKKGNRI